MLDFQLAHARARDAVHYPLDSGALVRELGGGIVLKSAARDRAEYLRRPDLGRQLSDESRALVEAHRGEYEVAFVIADGLSALAVHRHAPGLIAAVRETSQAPVTVVEQGRVAIGDEIGSILGASLVVVLIGERPGLSSPDSLGVYLTWGPRQGKTDAERNCISNIRAEGLSVGAAVELLRLLMKESRERRLSGVNLKPGQTFLS
ncbi:MAG: ethanolamine ammonia-lyase small subunit [Bryobacterales bacterium]|jgi:ethanolamine ammonia-lyase small subunit|nr:ethanolamine ammonia-lyase small subunit [Bryobacterales bacterium]